MIKKIFLFFVVIAIIGSGGYYYLIRHTRIEPVSYKTPEEADVFVRFGMEAFDSITSNYWDETTHYSLPTVFKLSLEKAANSTFDLSSTTREGTSKMLAAAMSKATSTEAKKALLLNTLIIATYNLQPAGRNGLLSNAQETQLRQTVANVNPSKNLYQDLGLEKGATSKEIESAFRKKEAELKTSTSSEAKAVLDQVTYAKKVLVNPDTKTLYDQNQIEPTVWPQKIGNTLYLYISKISPTTFAEFARAIENASSTKNLDSLILDVRGNVGGSLDFVQNFMGLFLGGNQYAFDLFRQGKYEAQRTVQAKYPLLDRYKEVGIITDNMTQSTAEVISATFKRLHLGKTIGTNTRGWGTVENTYPLATVIDEKTSYTLLLVNSITLRDDNQPIEGRGVDPDISTSDAKWKSKLPDHFHSSSLINALSQTVAKPPLR